MERLRDTARRDVTRTIDAEATAVEHLRARLATLGPAATLARGYAVVQRVYGDTEPEVLRSVDDAPPGTQIRVRLADGAVARRRDCEENHEQHRWAELGYEAARDELVVVVKTLELGGLDLDESLALWDAARRSPSDARSTSRALASASRMPSRTPTT